MKPGEAGSYTIPEFIVVCGMLVGAGLGYVVSLPVRGVCSLASLAKKGAKQ